MMRTSWKNHVLWRGYIPCLAWKSQTQRKDLGTENPRIVKEHIRNSPKFNIWCDLRSSQVTGLFFSKKQQSLSIPRWKWCISMLYIRPQLILQQNSSSVHWGLQLRTYLCEKIPGRWIDRESSFTWPPCSPDKKHWTFFVYVLCIV